MKTYLLILSILLTSCKTTSSIKPTSLFNGKNLNGWSVYGTEKWYVEDGLLTCENGVEEKFGYLGTTKNYKNFELNLDFKQNAKGNGGVFIHSAIKDTKINGWQVEIAPPGHYTGGIHSYEKGWLVKPEIVKDEAIKVNNWNHLKITVKGNKMTVWLNNTKMADLVDPDLKTKEGLIALQIHKGNVTKMQWKNIEIREL